TWSDVIAIPLNAPNAKEAHAFINYILRPDVIAKISNKIGYQNPNKDATALVDESLRNDPTIYIPEAERSNLYVLEPIPSSIERVRTRTWTSIKSNR
ncbi:extracellular solute-binding protein, partial [Gilvimarinus sp. SDUM040013]